MINHTQKEVYAFSHDELQNNDKFNHDTGDRILQNCIDKFGWNKSDIIQMRDCRFTIIYCYINGKWINSFENLDDEYYYINDSDDDSDDDQ